MVTPAVPGRPRAWSHADAAALAGLLALYTAFVARSWLAWGWLDVDYGREMWVPLRVARGDVLYRDVRYPYGPFSPYLHALGYRLWEPHLNVLYASGLVTATAIVVALWDIGRQIGSRLVAALAAALAMVDLMFVPGTHGHYSYVFPYAFPATHGLLFLLVTLAAGLRLLDGGGRGAAAVCGAAIGLALLTKQEFGAGAAVVGGLVAVGLGLRGAPPGSARRVALMVGLALGLPALGYGVLATRMPPAAIVTRGLFDPQYFEGSRRIMWIIAGLPPDASREEMAGILAALYGRVGAAYLVVAAALAAVGLIARARRGIFLVLAGGVVGWALLAPPDLAALRWLLAHRYGGLPLLLAAWLVVETVRGWREWRRAGTCAPATLQRWVAAMLAFALLVRVPAALVPGGYANFYLGLGIVLLLHLALDRLPAALGRAGARAPAARLAALALVAVATIEIGRQRWQAWGARSVDFVTPRGTLRVDVNDKWAPAYRGAMEIILAETRPEATVLAIPCETSLYFFTGRGNHLYETGLIAVVNDEAAERAYIAELERDPPALVLVSTRPQREYGHLGFGMDVNMLIAGWIEQHYAARREVGNVHFRIRALTPRAAG